METRKLYYEDCMMAQFRATVISCEAVTGGYEVTLDATAFYPEGGGQACDIGVLGGVQVLDVQERGETVIHLCDQPLTVGEQVEGSIDWNRRFDLMQQHTGEHIISGIVHRRYGYHNTGFHVGSEVLTVDFDGVIPAADLAEIEKEANEALWQNIPLKCWIPDPQELETVCYRTKRAIPWPVRIVQVPDWDSCACCGIHVATTGQVGLVKIFSAMGFRGGTRMEMACGKRALEILNQIFDQNRQVSQAFSAQMLDTGAAARNMNEVLENQKHAYSQLQRKLFAKIAEDYANQGNVLHLEEGLEPVMVRELADAIAERCGGTAAVFSGSDEKGYNFCMVTRNGDLRSLGKALTQRLNGRGGGKPICQQGRISATKAEVCAFFETNRE